MFAWLIINTKPTTNSAKLNCHSEPPDKASALFKWR